MPNLTLTTPPLDEVVLGVQLQDEFSDEGFALADFWPRIRRDFPNLERQPPLPPGVEDFEVPTGDEPSIQFLTGPISPRYWFVAADERRLVQLQPDRLLLNWRRRDPGDDYPRYTTLRAEFARLLGELEAAASDRTAPRKVEPSWCEISYINNVGPLGAVERQPLSEILSLVQAPSIDDLGAPEDTQLQQRYRILDSSERSVGRFHINAQPALRRSDRSPIYVLTLLARLRPAAVDIDSTLAAMDFAHDLVVDAFRDITTAHALAEWGLKTDHAADS